MEGLLMRIIELDVIVRAVTKYCLPGASAANYAGAREAALQALDGISPEPNPDAPPSDAATQTGMYDLGDIPE